jgi:tetratricopeptide (TPR) repeat protein
MKRINFKLSKSLIKAFDAYARSRDMSKSQQLRSWINGDLKNLIVVPSSNNEDNEVAFQLFLDKDDYKKLLKRCEMYGLSISSYIRLLLRNNLLPKTPIHLPTSTESERVNELWRRGDYIKIISLLSKDLSSVPEDKKILLARSYLGLNRYKEGEKVLDNIENYVDIAKNFQVFAEVIFCRANIAIIMRKLDSAKSLLGVVKNNTSKITLRQKGFYHLYMGLVCAYSEHTKEAHHHFSMCLDLLNIGKDQYEISTTYGYLAFIALRNHELDYAKDYVEKCENMVSSFDNKIAVGLYYMIAGRVETFSGSLAKSIVLLKKSLNINKQVLNYKSLFETNASTARSYYLLGDYKNSNIHIKNAEEIEKIIRPDMPDRLLHTMKLVNWPDENYYEKVKAIKELVNNPKPGDHKSPMQLLCYTMQYLHGVTRSDRSEGKRNLEILAKEGLYPQIRIAAKQTIKTKTPQPFAV